MSTRANFKYMTLTFGGIACALIVIWHQYRTDDGWVLADSGDPKVTHHPRLVIREFLDPILPDEDGVYRFEYWQDNIMRECISFSSDSFRARKGARLGWEKDGTCSAWLEDRKICSWHGAWSFSQ
ncbi:MAG: hypothetical protein JWR15_2722 [Prosthecobacter sp.]|nr:hypothetical protein [Prosthecobacter sp.]